MTSLLLWSVPALKVRRIVMLDDGSRVWATLMGNSDYSFYVTDEGDTLVQAIDSVSGTNCLRRKVMGEADMQESAAKRMVRRRVGSAATAPLKPHGVKQVPVVLVAFADKAFSVRETPEEVRAYYDLYCNGTRDGNLYTGHGSHGSIRDFFVEQSEGDFLPEFVPIGPVVLDQDYAYYGSDRGSSKDINLSAFRNEAIAKALTEVSDWSRFDNDGNGSVDMVFFVYAGLGQNNGGDNNTIWPSESTQSMTINGKKFATSAVCCELMPATRDDDGNVLTTRADGVGVFIHEFSHALGLPDFYDTNYVAFGMDLWSVMDYGEYGNNGYNPGNYTAYERDFMGWRPLIVIDDPCTLHIPCFAQGGNGYKIVNDANANEYYVIENRQAMGWDDYIGRRCTGLQVTHVDYSSSLWNSNAVNSVANHQRMTIIAANDDYRGSNTTTSGFTGATYRAVLAGNLFPGTSDIHELTDDTTPASVVYTGGFMGKPLLEITERDDGIVTVKFRPRGTLTQPANLRVEDLDGSSFTAAWDAVPDAEYYNVQLWGDGELLQQRDSLAFASADDACQAPFAALQDGVSYTFRVQALSDAYLNGAWTESEMFHASGSAIQPVPQSEQLVRIYSIDGQFVTECMGDELSRLSLHTGVYVVRSSNGRCRKVFVQ
ncbi:MAG: M6 family metalloprotease domain-containing protein [Bacteroidaceae bacterium]|nr:M6 family metalloprotease domain-containing protein [Bacteroidaceae bacterium]